MRVRELWSGRLIEGPACLQRGVHIRLLGTGYRLASSEASTLERLPRDVVWANGPG